MSDENTARPRTPRGKVQYGLIAQLSVCIPVDNRHSPQQLVDVEKAFLDAAASGDATDLLKLPGVRIARTDRPHRFGALPKPVEAGKGEPEADDGQTDIEDAIDGQEGDGEAEEGDAGEGEAEAPTGRGRGRSRAA